MDHNSKQPGQARDPRQNCFQEKIGRSRSVGLLPLLEISGLQIRPIPPGGELVMLDDLALAAGNNHRR